LEEPKAKHHFIEIPHPGKKSNEQTETKQKQKQT